MRKEDLLNITKDVVVIYERHTCMLHPCKEKVYLLSNLVQFDGCRCIDFREYRWKYNYSFWLIDKSNDRCDVSANKICKKLVPNSLGGL